MDIIITKAQDRLLVHARASLAREKLLLALAGQIPDGYKEIENDDERHGRAVLVLSDGAHVVAFHHTLFMTDHVGKVGDEPKVLILGEGLRATGLPGVFTQLRTGSPEQYDAGTNALLYRDGDGLGKLVVDLVSQVLATAPLADLQWSQTECAPAQFELRAAGRVVDRIAKCGTVWHGEHGVEARTPFSARELSQLAVQTSIQALHQRRLSNLV